MISITAHRYVFASLFVIVISPFSVLYYVLEIIIIDMWAERNIESSRIEVSNGKFYYLFFSLKSIERHSCWMSVVQSEASEMWSFRSWINRHRRVRRRRWDNNYHVDGDDDVSDYSPEQPIRCFFIALACITFCGHKETIFLWSSSRMFILKRRRALIFIQFTRKCVMWCNPVFSMHHLDAVVLLLSWIVF